MKNTLIYTNSASVAEKNGQRVLSGIKPTFSFNYDELQYHQSNKGYLVGTDWFDMTEAQEAEVEAYVEAILVDEALGAKLDTNSNNLGYLYETDWYVIRKLETGVEIPADVLTKRAAARLAIEDLTSYMF